jgi:hypothetical protein
MRNKFYLAISRAFDAAHFTTNAPAIKPHTGFFDNISQA